jgi:hypothetical protein
MIVVEECDDRPRVVAFMCRGERIGANVQVGDYGMDNIILDMGSDMNVISKNTWEMMVKPKLIW